MKKVTTYISEDGKNFASEQECSKYEKEQKKKENIAILEEVKRLDLELWNKYFKDSDAEGPELKVAYIWLRTDIVQIILASEEKPGLNEIKEHILKSKYGKKIAEELRFDKIEEEINVRSDWSNALKNVKEGTELSHKIGCGLSSSDLKQLATLHKTKKYRKKIEELLTDCNFHAECNDFYNGNYDKYIF